jgi:hypothetical protein
MFVFILINRGTGESSSPHWNRTGEGNSATHDVEPIKRRIPTLFVDHLLDSQPTQGPPDANVSTVLRVSHEIMLSHLCL